MKYLSSLPESETKAILGLVDLFISTWHSKNAEQFGTVFTDDAEFTDIVNQIARGKNEIIDQHRFPFSTVNKQAVFIISDLYMRAIADNLIMVTGSWVLEKATTPKGDPVPDRNGILQIICRKENDVWKISLVHNTDISKVYQGMVDTSLRFYSSK
ncbi:MAG: SgcJ/EcaC family oxidoreductase [Flavobacteriaceae bacterium]